MTGTMRLPLGKSRCHADIEIFFKNDFIAVNRAVDHRETFHYAYQTINEHWCESNLRAFSLFEFSFHFFAPTSPYL